MKDNKNDNNKLINKNVNMNNNDKRHMKGDVDKLAIVFLSRIVKNCQKINQLYMIYFKWYYFYLINLFKYFLNNKLIIFWVNIFLLLL